MKWEWLSKASSKISYIKLNEKLNLKPKQATQYIAGATAPSPLSSEESDSGFKIMQVRFTWKSNPRRSACTSQN